MKKWFIFCLTLLMTLSVSAVAEENVEKPYIKIGDFNDDVIALHQKLVDLGYYHVRTDSVWGPASARALMILQENIDEEATGIVESKERFDEYVSLENVIGKNLAIGTSNEWSEWFTPAANEKNKTFNPFYAILPVEKVAGDYYTCSVEIEFKDVSASTVEDAVFIFRAQGAVDETWEIPNIWTGALVRLTSSPENGVYQYTTVAKITEKSIGAEQFILGFRCDYWGSGQFRVKEVKVEKGSKATEWCE